MTNSSLVKKKWLIEIDGLAFFKIGGFSMAVLNNQMVPVLFIPLPGWLPIPQLLAVKVGE